MTLFELQAWLGHRSPATTQHYVTFTPTRLARAYSKAQYFQRNLRMMDVLIDRQAIEHGHSDEPWRYYDLGHGLCSYECVFHTKLDSDFAASWTGISREGGHGFHGKLDSDFTRSWTVTS